MHEKNVSRRQALMGAAALMAGAAPRPKTPSMTPEERAAVDAALGKKGSYVEAQAVHTVPLPRNDLAVRIKGEPVPVPLGFGGWVSLKKTVNGGPTVLMSDTVLLQEEVNPLISAAHDNGLEISAIHNHFFYEEPRIVYMHLHGHGEAGDLARRYAAAIRTTRLHPANQPPPGPPPKQTAGAIFDLPALDAVVGRAGAVNGPTYKYTVGRDDLRVLAMGAEITTAIGLNSWASFAGAMDRAHIAGDIAMLEPEVNPVIRSLRRSGLEVVAVHNHMIGEEPRIFFLHYYGKGPAADLARGFRAALDALGGKGMRH